MSPGSGTTRAPRCPYENWRPAIDWAVVVIPVENDRLVVIDTSGYGHLGLPGTVVPPSTDPAEAARFTLLGHETGLPITERIAVERTQTRRRQVNAHLFRTATLTHHEAATFRTRDGTLTRILTRRDALPLLPTRARERALKALAS
ncbi:hypothetical protein ACGH2B_24885 [Streptomyces sp. BBFR2]|uniref:hypothetical protein n=1 Tax=Streptomyces sp. BBFR2 TaxID=3372854 RepID=UPI0037D9E848